MKKRFSETSLDIVAFLESCRVVSEQLADPKSPIRNASNVVDLSEYRLTRKARKHGKVAAFFID